VTDPGGGEGGGVVVAMLVHRVSPGSAHTPDSKGDPSSRRSPGPASCSV